VAPSASATEAILVGEGMNRLVREPDAANPHVR
jgi:hypothetical protein